MTSVVTVNPIRSNQSTSQETTVESLTQEEEWYRRLDSNLQSCIACLICTIVLGSISAAIIFAKR